MLNIAVFADSPARCQQIEEQVNKKLAVPADTEFFYIAENFLTAVKTDHYNPKIVILWLGKENAGGIELARELNLLIPTCSIIFLTDNLRQMPAVYSANHIWTIPAEKTEEYLGAALQKAFQMLSEKETGNNILRLHIRGRNILLSAKEVIFMERRAHETILCTVNGEMKVAVHPSQFITQELSPVFIHCHQSFWVNCSFVRELAHGQFILTNGQTIPLGRTYRKEAKEQFYKFLNGC